MKSVVVKSHMRADGTTVKSHIRNPFAKSRVEKATAYGKKNKRKIAVGAGAAAGLGAAGYMGYKHRGAIKSGAQSLYNKAMTKGLKYVK